MRECFLGPPGRPLREPDAHCWKFLRQLHPLSLGRASASTSARLLTRSGKRRLGQANGVSWLNLQIRWGLVFGRPKIFPNFLVVDERYGKVGEPSSPYFLRAGMVSYLPAAAIRCSQCCGL